MFGGNNGAPFHPCKNACNVSLQYRARCLGLINHLPRLSQCWERGRCRCSESMLVKRVGEISATVCCLRSVCSCSGDDRLAFAQVRHGHPIGQLCRPERPPVWGGCRGLQGRGGVRHGTLLPSGRVRRPRASVTGQVGGSCDTFELHGLAWASHARWSAANMGY